jgi:hypothetical protein
MFANWNPTVVEDLLGAQQRTSIAGNAELPPDLLPIFQPAEAFVDAFAARYRMSAPFLRRLCDAASREIGQELIPRLRSRLDEEIRDPNWELGEALDVMAGRRPRQQHYEESLAAIQRVAEQGLQAPYSDHLDLMVVADDAGADLGVPFQRMRLRP